MMNTLILDLDDLMTVNVLGKADSKRNERIQERFPGSLCWDLEFPSSTDEKVNVLQVIVPGWIPCLNVIVHKWKWKLVIFSSGCKERNVLFRDHLAKELKMVKGDLKYFSSDDLVPSDEEKKDDEHLRLKQYFYGTYKKDLVHLGFDLKSTVLVDDDPSYIKVPEQWPQLILNSNGGYNSFAYWIKSGNKHHLKNKNLQTFLDIPFVLLGFLHECKTIVEEKTCSLREAMKLLLPVAEVDGQKSPSKEERKKWLQVGK